MKRLTLLAALALLGTVAACDNPGGSDQRPPAKLAVLSGDLQNDTVGMELAQPLVVRVLDDRDRPVRNQLVNFVVTAGGGSVFAGSALTNADGVAQERWRLGTVAGDTQRVEARAVDSNSGQAVVFATFRAVGVPDRPASLAAVGGTTRTGVAGVAIADSLAVKVTDAHGNAVPGVTVTFAASSGGSVSPTTAVTRADGTARTRWTPGSPVGGQSASATVAGLTAVAFTAVVSPGAVTRVVLAPESIRFNALGQTQALTVSAFDAFNNPVPGRTALVVSQNDAVAALQAGPVVRAAGNGTTRLIATVQGSTAADTTVVTVQQVARAVLVSPAGATLPVGSSVQLQGTAQDARGNVVAGAAFTYTASGPSITVTQAGVVTAVRAGVDSVRVATDSASAWVRVEVQDYLHGFQVSAGATHACALRNDERAVCWGLNTEGQLGTGAAGGPEVCRNSVPCHMVASEVAGGHRFMRISAGTGTTCAVTQTGGSGGVPYCWGSGDHGQLGNGGTSDSATPVAVAGGHVFSQVAVGGNHACGLTPGGTVWCWGLGSSGQLGNGDTASSPVPVRVNSSRTFLSITAGHAHTCATSGLQVFCWGANDNGQLGDGTSTQRSEPVATAGGSAFRAVTAEMNTTCAIGNLDAAWCWGSNQFGALGTGSTALWSATPAQVSGGMAFRSLSSGGIRVCGVTTSGAAYCWGALQFSSNGNVNVSSDTPVAVSGSVNFSTVDASDTYTCGVDTTSRVRCWGRNARGTLGNGTSTDAYTPVFVRMR